MTQPERQYKYDIFVSYSNHDLKDVKDIVYFLEHIGVRPWFDKARIPYGEIPERIKDGISQSRFFAFFLSNNTGRSQWLELEAAYFRELRSSEKPSPFILVKLSEGELPPSIANLAPRIIHYFDFEKSFIDGFAELARIFVNDSIGMLKYYPFRGQVPPDVWDMLNAKANREIKLMGHSVAPAFTDGRDRRLVLPALRDRGVKISVVLLTPNIPKLQQLQEVQLGLEQRIDLRQKINNTIERIRQLKQDLRDAGSKSRLQVRITDRIMYSSVSIFDSVALITNYSSREEIGNNSPAFLVHATEPERGGLFTFYNEEFERYWKQGTHPEEERRKTEFDDSTRILKYENQVSKIERWISGEEESLPPPAMLVIFPTYECSRLDREGNERSLCENCIYRQRRSKQHLEFNTLSSVLHQAVFELGIQNIEFSGGGEPLQYQDVERLLHLLIEIKGKSEGVRFGLLTNGLHLNNALVPLIASIFSYVRFSYAEGIQADREAEEDFITNLVDILKHVENSFGAPRIGLKVLLSKQNAKDLVNRLLNLKEELGSYFQRVDHIRVKAMRSPRSLEFEPSAYDSLLFRNEFYDYLFTYREDWAEDIQVDLDLRYVAPDFKCRLSPLFAVVDPIGSLLACWNYLRDYQKLKIGDLRSKKFKDLWGSRWHRRVVTSINSQTVCNAKNGCPCRFVRYQDVLEKSDQFDSRYILPDINGFL